MRSAKLSIWTCAGEAILSFCRVGTRLRTASASGRYTGLSAGPETTASMRMLGVGSPESRNTECISSPRSGRASLPCNPSPSQRAVRQMQKRMDRSGRRWNQAPETRPHHQDEGVCDLSRTPDGIVLIHEHEAADNRIKRLVERHGRRIAYDKRNVGRVAAQGTRTGPLDCFRRSIYPKDVPAFAD